tara:strand:- start:39 stop:1211 length:1173 start_codon:yes stop_codon:yes gene_type:complete
MAYKLPWGSNFTTDDLRVDYKDDIYQDFPFLNLKEDGLQMKALTELHSPNENTVRGTGAKGLIATKQQAIKGSVKKGWDRTSWPIPFLLIGLLATIFDRRHTFGACQDLDLQYGNVKEVPTAEYERVFPKIGGVINTFCDESIAMMASMWGNVYGPIPDDTKDHQFENTIIRILRLEEKRLDSEVHSLFTRDTAKLIFKYMGGEDRYDDPRTLARIPNNVVSALNSPESVKGTNCVNHNEEDLDAFIESNEDWQPNNTENIDTIFITHKISDIAYHTREVVARVLQKVCEVENKHEKGKPLKKIKILLWNEKNSRKADKIVRSRDIFVDELNKSWYTRRDNVLLPLEEALNPSLLDNYRKKLNDLNMEIWCMKQLENEEVHELIFDKEEG